MLFKHLGWPADLIVIGFLGLVLGYVRRNWPPSGRPPSGPHWLQALGRVPKLRRGGGPFRPA